MRDAKEQAPITDEKNRNMRCLLGNDRSHISALFHQLSCCVKLGMKNMEESALSDQWQALSHADFEKI